MPISVTEGTIQCWIDEAINPFLQREPGENNKYIQAM